MDADNKPTSEMIDDNGRPYKPIKGILVGLGYTIVLVTIVSILWLLAMGAILGFDLTSPTLEFEMANSSAYLLTDTIVSAVILYFGGRAIGERTPGKELKFGFILTAITIAIYLAIMIPTDSFKTYPLIYTASSLIITAIAILFGSASKRVK